eukprot:2426673-Ditylum_brightwellii.AAC.1
MSFKEFNEKTVWVMVVSTMCGSSWCIPLVMLKNESLQEVDALMSSVSKCSTVFSEMGYIQILKGAKYAKYAMLSGREAYGTTFELQMKWVKWVTYGVSFLQSIHCFAIDGGTYTIQVEN